MDLIHVIEFHQILVSINAPYFKACQRVDSINSNTRLEVPLKIEFQSLRLVDSDLHLICEREDEG